MLVYIIPTIYCLWGIYQYDYRKRSEWKLECYYFLSLYLAVIAGFSYKVGGDAGFYMESYAFIPTLENLKKQIFLILLTNHFISYYVSSVNQLHRKYG